MKSPKFYEEFIGDKIDFDNAIIVKIVALDFRILIFDSS